MKNITLEEMFDILTNCIIKKTDPPPFYYKFEYEKNHPRYIEITEVDLLRDRFKTINDDFSAYEWEIEKSNIFVEDNLWKK